LTKAKTFVRVQLTTLQFKTVDYNPKSLITLVPGSPVVEEALGLREALALVPWQALVGQLRVQVVEHLEKVQHNQISLGKP
jgi:hypothetical protein